MKRTLLLLAFSLSLGALGLWIAGGDARLLGLAHRPTDVSAGLVAVAFGSLIAIWVVPLLRLQYLAATHGYLVRPHAALLAHVLMVFGAAVTPGGTGGAPALVAALARFGIPVGTSLGISIQIFVLDLVLFAWLIPLGLLRAIATDAVDLPLAFEAISTALVLGAVAAAFWLWRCPRVIARLILALARVRWFHRWSARLRRQARAYFRSATTFAKLGIASWLWLQAITFVGWIGNFVLLWSLARLFGHDVGLVDLITLMSVVTLVSFFVPTPGASGFIEAAVVLGTDGAASTGHLVWWRLGSFYVAYAFGPLAGAWLTRSRPPAQPRRGVRLR